jgi:hypothetical protein
MVGDIVAFQGHVAYVTSIDWPDANYITVEQVEGYNAPEQTGLKLSWVINGRSANPTVIARG